MKKILLLVLVLLPTQVSAFECIVKLDASTAILEGGDGEIYTLNKGAKRITIDNCNGLQLKRGQAKIYFANEEGYPDEYDLLLNQKVTGNKVVSGGEGAPPFIFLFAQLKRIISGDRVTSHGEKRAFSNSGLEGMPNGRILPPAKNWRFSPLTKQKGLNFIDITDNKGFKVVTVRADENGAFVMNGKLIHAGNVYHWNSRKKQGTFHVLSRSEAQLIKIEARDLLGRESSKDLERFMYASVYRDHDLFFDANRILNNE